MGVFRKFIQSEVGYVSCPSDHYGDVRVEVPHTIANGDGSTTTFVTHKTVKIQDYSKSLDLPSSDEYKLEDILKTGQVPEEVPVSGLIDQGISVRDLANLFDRARSAAPSVEVPDVKPDVQSAVTE